MTPCSAVEGYKRSEGHTTSVLNRVLPTTSLHEDLNIYIYRRENFVLYILLLLVFQPIGCEKCSENIILLEL